MNKIVIFAFYIITLSVNSSAQVTPQVTPQVTTQAKPQELIKYRQSAMMFMRWNTSIIKNQLAQHPPSYNQQQLAAAARAIVAVANSDLAALFKPGTEVGTGWKSTRAKPELLNQPEQLSIHLTLLRDRASELELVADSGNIALIQSKFANLFSACRSCHRRFRSQH